LDENYVSCVIVDNPETVFLQLDDILSKKAIEGVKYKNETLSQNEEINKKLICAKKLSDNIENNLDSIPSPYLNHIFDNYIQTAQLLYGNKFRAFLVSSRGCNFRCYYCSRSVKFEKVQYFSVERFYDEMEYLFNFFKVRNFFVLDNTFIHSRKRLEDFEKEFERRIVKNPDLMKISLFIMNRPETIDEETVKILKQINVKFIQIGLQTINPRLQLYMRRNLDVIYFQKISNWLKNMILSCMWML
jgi:radical SAM superfamily enzyme YgiQ (UPF0313 family)